jgi:hypothetical protein
VNTPFNVGDRIELVFMGVDDPCPIEEGAQGSVNSVQYFEDSWQVGVTWDNGRTLSLVMPPDEAKLIE